MYDIDYMFDAVIREPDSHVIEDIIKAFDEGAFHVRIFNSKGHFLELERPWDWKENRKHYFKNLHNQNFKNEKAV